MRIKNKLKGLVISERDKTGCKLYCECPIVHYNKLRRSFYELEGTLREDGKQNNIYEIIDDETTKQIINRTME